MKQRNLLLLPLLVGSGFAQTRLDLKNQSSNIDFTQAATTAPVKMGGALPGTCTVGELFFLNSAAPGQNLYACTATNTFTLETGGASGTTDLSGLTDLQTSFAGDTYTVAGGAIRYGNVTTTLGTSSLQVLSSTDTGTIRFYVSYNAGSPQMECAIPGSFTGTYSPSGMTCVSGNSFPANSLPLATGNISSGLAQSPLDARALHQSGPLPVAGIGLTSNHDGQAITLNTDATAVVMKFTGSGAPASIPSSTLGDLYIDSSGETVYGCMNPGGGCSGVGSGEWVALN